MSQSGVPVKLMYESEGHVIEVELTNGDVYRGKMMEVEDNMNVHLRDCSILTNEGETKNAQDVYLRGSNVLLMRVPDMLQKSPMFKRFDPRTKTTQLGLGKGYEGQASQFQRTYRPREE